jgi:hypothetical protein
MIRGHEWRKFDLSRRQKLSIVGLFGLIRQRGRIGKRREKEKDLHSFFMARQQQGRSLSALPRGMHFEAFFL